MKQIILLGLVISLISNCLWAETIDRTAFIRETQKMTQTQDAIKVVWWIPIEFWKMTLYDNPNVTEVKKTEFYKLVDDYIVFCIIDAKVGSFGSITPVPRDTIIYRTSLKINENTPINPLLDSELPSDTVTAFAMMKPVLANMLGQLGQGLEFVFFNGTDSEGKKMLEPKENAAFIVTTGGESFKWRLPLGSLLPLKLDQQSGEQFPGNYIYNPFTGNKLGTAQ